MCLGRVDSACVGQFNLHLADCVGQTWPVAAKPGKCFQPQIQPSYHMVVSNNQDTWVIQHEEDQDLQNAGLVT